MSIIFQESYTTIIRSQFHDFTLPARGIINVPRIKRKKVSVKRLKWPKCSVPRTPIYSFNKSNRSVITQSVGKESRCGASRFIPRKEKPILRLRHIKAIFILAINMQVDI